MDEPGRYLDMPREGLARLVLALIMEEMLHERLLEFKAAATPQDAGYSPTGFPNTCPLSQSSASKNSASLGTI